MPLRAQGCWGGCNPRQGRALGVDEVFSTAHRLVGDEAFCHQKPVGRIAQGGVVVGLSPASALIVPQAEVLLQILVVALDALALMCNADEFGGAGVFG